MLVSLVEVENRFGTAAEFSFHNCLITNHLSQPRLEQRRLALGAAGNRNRAVLADALGARCENNSVVVNRRPPVRSINMPKTPD
jgi:hypothetical protein